LRLLSLLPWASQRALDRLFGLSAVGVFTAARGISVREDVLSEQ
jgi:hypothetical protein